MRNCVYPNPISQYLAVLLLLWSSTYHIKTNYQVTSGRWTRIEDTVRVARGERTRPQPAGFLPRGENPRFRRVRYACRGSSDASKGSTGRLDLPENVHHQLEFVHFKLVAGLSLHRVAHDHPSDRLARTQGVGYPVRDSRVQPLRSQICLF